MVSIASCTWMVRYIETPNVYPTFFVTYAIYTNTALNNMKY